MNITPWTLYWILKLDDVKETLNGVSMLGIVGLALMTVVLIVMYAVGDIDDNPDVKAGVLCLTKKAKQYVWPVFLCFLMSSFVPSTKQMAAIITVPAIANSEFVTTTLPKEGRELYELTKQWLGDQVKKTTVEAPKPSN